MNAPISVQIIGVTIVLALLIGATEIYAWYQGDRAAPRYSAPARALIFAGLDLLTLAVVLFPQAEAWLLRFMPVAMAAGVVVLILIALLIRVGIPSVNRVLREAMALDEAGRTLDAITVLENHRPKARRWGKSFEAVLLSNLAACYAKTGDTARAIATVDEAIAASPQDPTIYAAKGGILAESGELDAAFQELHVATNRFPKSVVLQTTKAEIEIRLGQLSGAGATLDQVEQILDQEQFVDVLDRAEWREVRVKSLRSQIADVIRGAQG